MRWQMFISCALSAKRTGVFCTLPPTSMIGGAGAVDHDVGDVVARQQRLERAIAQDVVADVLEQLLLLGNRHHDALDLDDLADDVADLLARGSRLQLGELRQVDGVDQRVEDGRLDVVVFLRVAPFLHHGLGARRRTLQCSDLRLGRSRLDGSRLGRRHWTAGWGTLCERLPNIGLLLTLELQLLEQRAQGRQRRLLLLFLVLLAVRQGEGQLTELGRGLRLAGELLDHLAVVGCKSERLAVELDHQRRIEIERGGELLDGDLRALRHFRPC